MSAPGRGPGRDELESLFELAGRRARLPEAEVAPIREQARAAWRRQVRRGARRRAGARAAGIALLALALGVVLGRNRPGGEAPPMPVAEVIRGTAAPAQAARVLVAGAAVRTAAGEGLALRLPGGSSLRIAGDSRVRLDAPGRVALERGALYLDAHPGRARDPLEIETPAGSVRHLGTQFELRLLERDGRLPDLRVAVREGVVSVRRDGGSHLARAGEVLTLTGSGELRRAPLDDGQRLFAWAERAAPPIAIEGVPLADFLDWAARELGLDWRTGAGELERTARATILHGSIDGLSPEEALAVVLPGCGLRHRRSAGRLVLEPEREP